MLRGAKYLDGARGNRHIFFSLVELQEGATRP